MNAQGDICTGTCTSTSTSTVRHRKAAPHHHQQQAESQSQSDSDPESEWKLQHGHEHQHQHQHHGLGAGTQSKSATATEPTTTGADADAGTGSRLDLIPAPLRAQMEARRQQLFDTEPLLQWYTQRVLSLQQQLQSQLEALDMETQGQGEELGGQALAPTHDMAEVGAEAVSGAASAASFTDRRAAILAHHQLQLDQLHNKYQRRKRKHALYGSGSGSGSVDGSSSSVSLSTRLNMLVWVLALTLICVLLWVEYGISVPHVLLQYIQDTLSPHNR